MECVLESYRQTDRQTERVNRKLSLGECKKMLSLSLNLSNSNLNRTVLIWRGEIERQHSREDVVSTSCFRLV